MAGVELDRVDAPTLDAALRRYKQATDGGIPVRVLRLSKWVRYAIPAERRAPCASCGGEGDTDAACCPYCGDGFEPEPTALERVLRSPAAVLPAAPGSKAVVVVLSAEPTRKELADAVERVRDCMRRCVGGLWDLGCALLAVYEPRLYLARFSTWDEFCFAELGMAAPTALRLMACAKAFDRRTVEELGPSRLVMALRVPEERRAELLARARAGLGVGELAREAARAGLLGRPQPPGSHPLRCSRPAPFRLPQGGHDVVLEGVEVPRKLRGALLGKGVLQFDDGELRVRVLVSRGGLVTVELTAKRKED